MTSRSWTRQAKHFRFSPGFGGWRRFANGVILLPHSHLSSATFSWRLAFWVLAMIMPLRMLGLHPSHAALSCPAVFGPLDGPDAPLMEETVETFLRHCRVSVLELLRTGGHKVPACAPRNNESFILGIFCRRLDNRGDLDRSYPIPLPARFPHNPSLHQLFDTRQIKKVFFHRGTV